MKYEEKQLETENIYSGKIINVRKDGVLLPNGRRSVREVVEHPGGVCVAPLTAEGELIFVRQFRYPYAQEILELPAGKLDRKGENPLEGGKRELREETGASAREYVSLGKLYPSPGYSNEIIYMYLAKGLSYGDQQPDDDEFIDVVKLPFAKALRMVMDGEIPDAKSQTAVLKAAFLLGMTKY